MEKKFSSFFNTSISFNPWYFFLIFLISNTLLSYFPLSFYAKLSIGIIGVILPFSFALWLVLENRLKKKLSPSSFTLTTAANGSNEKLPLGLWLFFGFLVFFTRFYKLTSIPSWPISDEGIFATMSLGLLKKWNWSVLWGDVHFEPLLIWALGDFFKIITPSFLSLRLFPALISIGTILLSYWASRQFFSKFISFIYCWVFAFSFWEFSFMRLCVPEILIVFFQFSALALLGIFIKKKTSASKWFFIFALSIAAGLGFYSYLNWVVAWFFIASILWMLTWGKKNTNWKYLITFTAVSSLLALPWVQARLSPGNLNYVHASFEPSLFLNSCLSYLIGLFWDSKKSFPFGPNWGGMFDPLTGSLIFLGVFYVLANIEKKLLALLSLGLFASMLPGTLTNYFELHRITPSLPFWIALAVLGIKSLLPDQSLKKSYVWLIALGVIFLAFNAYNFAVPYCDITRVPPERQWRSVQYEDSYNILKSLSAETGPLYVFTEFNTDYDNKTLNIAVYPFDCLQNPVLFKASPQWAVVIANIYYAPYFIEKFKNIKFKILKSNRPLPQPIGIFLIPVSKIPDSILKNWLEADQIYRNANIEIKNKRPMDTFSQFSGHFSSLKNKFPKDPFLTSVYWEKYALDQFLDRDFKSAAQSYEYAIQQGYPAAHLYYNRSLCLKLSGENSESKKDFLKAVNIAKRSGISP